MSQLVLLEQGAAALTRSREEAYLIARQRVKEPHSENTKRAYRTAFKQWCSYCDASGLPWAPVDAMELVTYCEKLRREGKAPNTVRLHLSAICSLDVASRITPTDPEPQSLRLGPIIKRWEQSWTRENPKRGRRQSAALAQSDLERLLAAAAEPQRNTARRAHLVRYVRDRCLILFGVTGAFRGNDLVQLEIGDVQTSERGLRVLVRASKTDQEGLGKEVGLMPQGRVAVCPVAAFAAWRSIRGEEPGPLFLGVGRDATLERTQLSERQVQRLIADYAKRAGLELRITTHSLRATFATLAAQQGKHIDRIMAHGRWLSANTAIGYMRQAELFDDNASAGLFD